jgi:hypothetical protein
MDGVDYRTTDLLKWGVGTGAGSGGNLTPVQVDLNFWNVYSRLKTLEDDPPSAVSVSGFTVIGSQFQVNLSDGSHAGPYDLPIATFTFRGNWTNGVTYSKLDTFRVVSRGLYLVLQPHTTPALPAVFNPLAVDGSSNPLYLLVYGEDTFIYDFGFFYPGRVGTGIEVSAAIAGHVFVREVILPAGLSGSKASLKVAPAASLSFGIEHNGTNVGSLDFTIGSTIGAFTFADDVDCVVGDRLTLIRPTAIDSAARELSVTILGTRV